MGTVYGLGAGTVAMASGTITYTLTTAATIQAGEPIYISFTGMTNPNTAGTETMVMTTETSTREHRHGHFGVVTFRLFTTTAPVTMNQTLTFTSTFSNSRRLCRSPPWTRAARATP